MLDGREICEKFDRDIEDIMLRYGFCVALGVDENNLMLSSIDKDDMSVRYSIIRRSLDSDTCVCSSNNGWSIKAISLLGDYFWSFVTNLPHSLFDAFRNGEKFSEGIVFEYNTLNRKAPPIVSNLNNKTIAFKHYLLIYGFDKYFESENAVSIKDFLLQFLDYTGNNRDLIVKGLNGMTTDQEMVDFINMVTDNNVNAVHQISQTIYQK